MALTEEQEKMLLQFVENSNKEKEEALKKQQEKEEAEKNKKEEPQKTELELLKEENEKLKTLAKQYQELGLKVNPTNDDLAKAEAKKEKENVDEWLKSL